jgi:hypothetical protein
MEYLRFFGALRLEAIAAVIGIPIRTGEPRP